MRLYITLNGRVGGSSLVAYVHGTACIHYEVGMSSDTLCWW